MKKTIFIVEDNGDIGELIQLILSVAGVETFLYNSVNAFNNRPMALIPDMVILDIMLPDGSGLDICRTFKSSKLTERIPVFMMSAHVNGKALAEEANADGFIGKPFNIDAFTSIVNEQLGFKKDI